jgi:hypothetical protein
MIVSKNCIFFEKENEEKADIQTEKKTEIQKENKSDEQVIKLKIKRNRKLKKVLKTKDLKEAIFKKGRWSSEEQKNFINKVLLYGGNWKKVKKNNF